MNMPAPVRGYMLNALDGSPVVIEKLLEGIGEEDMIWDSRPDRDRFNLREILAHLADWNIIFLDRLKRTLNEEHPTLPDVDEGEIAVQNNYLAINPLTSIENFRNSRAAMMQFLATLNESDWARSAMKVPLGELTMEQQGVLILSHDGYHLRQIVQWLQSEGR